MEASSKVPPLGSGRAFTSCLPPINPNVNDDSSNTGPSRNNKRHVTISQMTRSLVMGNNEDPNYPTNVICSTSNPTETQTKSLLSQEEEEKEAARIKELRGKEPVPSDGKDRGEEVVGKLKGVDSFSKRVWMKRLLGNYGSEVVRVVEEEDVPSVATLALLGKALNGPGRRDVRKKHGCTVWNTD